MTIRALVVAGALVLFGGAEVAGAQLLRTTAYLAAQQDARDRALELGATNSYSLPSCKRRSTRRIDCRVWAKGRRFVVDAGGSHYLHRRCEWTVVTRQWRLYPYYRTSRRAVRCRDWTSRYLWR